MKKLVAMLLSLVVLFSTVGIVSASATEAQQYVATNYGWVTIYKYPSTEKGSLIRLQLGEKATLLSKYNSYWYKVSFKGYIGYITTNSKYTHLVTEPVLDPLEVRREKVVQTALSLQGQVNYVHWSDRQEVTAPYATDCSGFTALVYRLADVGTLLVNRDDDDQALVGESIPYGQFEKGDLIFTWTNTNDRTNVGHVGIYIGDGKIIHNAGYINDVIISNVYSDYYKNRFIVARRVLN